MNEITIRKIEYARDRACLEAFIDERDSDRLGLLKIAIAAGDAFILVADDCEKAIGWVSVSLTYRNDQGWNTDGDTMDYLRGGNAYLENIAVAEPVRSRGIGARLLHAAEHEARSRGKKNLWLHTNDSNVGAHRFYEREGWDYVHTITPVWDPGRLARVYQKVLGVVAEPKR